MAMHWIRRLAFMWIAAVAMIPTLAHAENAKLALVIGNAAYKVAPLKNPVNDARAVGRTLREFDFEVVERIDANLAGMLEAMREFLDRGRDRPVRLVYFAGHGTQFRGKNYLLPVDATVKSDEDLPLAAVNATEFFDKLGTEKRGVNLVFVDACRNMPYPIGPRTRDLIHRRTLAPGFAPQDDVKGTLIAFSTAPGQIAFDGAGEHSAYTKHLLAHIRLPGVPIESVLKRVRSAVTEETQARQVPWETSSLVGDFCFVPNGRGACGLATR